MSQLKELVTVEIPQDLKLKLFNSFINNSQSISLSEFNWIKGLNPELTGKMLEKLELSPLNNDNFISLVGVVPKTLDIPSDLLLKLTLTGSLSKKKGSWLEKVIRKNVPQDLLQEISRNLLGRELSNSTTPATSKSRALCSRQTAQPTSPTVVLPTSIPTSSSMLDSDSDDDHPCLLDPLVGEIDQAAEPPKRVFGHDPRPQPRSSLRSHFYSPFSSSSCVSSFIQEKIDTIMHMGFAEEDARAALNKNYNNLNMAIAELVDPPSTSLKRE
ncbi:hypothetical protein GEMRC1_013545 [Eukaryota sp. GEM-RC1]